MKTSNRERRSDTSVQGLVCVVDGDRGIRNSLFTLLGTLGIMAATFSTAEEALDRLKVEKPSFLIVELDLPGIGGFELKEALDKGGILVPVIGLTSEADEEKKKRATKLGFLELVEKPFVYWSVVERVQETLGAHG
ncbi:MAG: response regulator [Gemmatimonadota bacterium]|jgi:FixJ family two-component response regulator